MIGFALCHGWAFDRAALLPLASALRERFPYAPLACFDLGFTGSPQSPGLAADTAWVAVGHSYGFAYLMQQPVAWHAAVSINGFTRFCRRAGQREGTPVRLLDAMCARLQNEPHAVVGEFRARCGEAGAIAQDLQPALLLEHLMRLRDLELALPDCRLLALATQDDAIVAPLLSNACFERPGVRLQMLAGTHVSLLREPAIAARLIDDFCRELPCAIQ